MKFRVSSKELGGKRSLSIIAEVNEKVPRKLHNKSLEEALPRDYWHVVSRALGGQGSTSSMKAVTPQQAFYLLRELDKGFIQEFISRREILFLSYLPITPNCHRLVERYEFRAGDSLLSYDERTKSYRRLADVGRKINEFKHHQQFEVLATSYIASQVLDCFNSSKLRLASSSREDSTSLAGMRWFKEVVLSKRTDHVFRMVIVGDPNVKLGEIGVPLDVSENMVVCEQVYSHNCEKMNKKCNLYLLTRDGLQIRRNGKLTVVNRSNQLQEGDVVYRPIENGDLILVNRPPSVHQHSLIAFSTKILPNRSVASLNPLCCAPFGADFDGDCLHGYVAQSLCSKVELQELVSLEHQLLNGQDGRSLISLSHDSLAAAYLLTGSQVVLNKYNMQQLEMHSLFNSPPPSIVKSPKLVGPHWTGEQLFSMFLPPTLDFNVAKKNLLVDKGELLSSPSASFWLQNSAAGIFTTMFRKYGREALYMLNAAQDILCEYLTMRGLSVSLADVCLSVDPYSRREMMDEVYCALEEAEDACQVKQLILESGMELTSMIFDDKTCTMDCMNQETISTRKRQISHASYSAFKDVFLELQTVIKDYMQKDNSILAMIHAGSKGSLMKLVQLGACLGIQLSAGSFPFRVPDKLSCEMWNSMKCDGTLDVATNSPSQQNSYAIVDASFFEGLNPLQCLVHSISGRANLFSENADLPGTLTRKLMFYMRDLYVAYDGSVRNAHGQNIVQFSYGTPEEHEGYYDVHSEFEAAGGEPVGAWAACSISEAAYGALDCPMNSLEDSPLMKLKKVLENGKGMLSSNQVAILLLSKRLSRIRYGFEYGSLQIKNHLERVLFSDVVSSVAVFLGDPDIRDMKYSPWITHFYVSKDIMLKKRLNVRRIISVLDDSYNDKRDIKNLNLPRISIMSKVRSSVDNQESDDTCCILVAAEISGSREQLATVTNLVIPVLLKTIISGFGEFKKVEILCDPMPDTCNELFLKVTISEDCLPVQFWSFLQNACVPVMDLIDWERSHPDSVNDIFSMYGIDAACNYFLQSLKSTTKDVGRSINLEHLLMVKECLCSTGEFNGLSIRGLRLQRRHSSTSSPFNEACFSKPGHCFLNAAKKGSVDHLCGTLDAMAWGKVAPVGTGGSFEIIYANQAPDQTIKGNIYETLSRIGISSNDVNEMSASGGQDNPEKCMPLVKPTTSSCCTEGHIYPCKCSEVPPKKKPFYSNNPLKNINGQRKSASVNVCKQAKLLETSTLNSKNDTAKICSLADIVDAYSSLRTILFENQLNSCLGEKDKSLVMQTLIHHPNRDAKIGNGVKDIKIGYNPLHPNSRCFVLLRTDGTQEDFSYNKCIIGAAYQISQDSGTLVEKMLSSKRK